MSRFVSDRLDLSRFPAPLAIRGIDFEKIVAERKAKLTALFQAGGVPYDVTSLELDSGVILQEADAYREMLMLAAINDSVKAVMVAFAIGSDLDHMAAGYGLKRRIITPATTTTPAVMESDEEFRRRTLLAPEAFGAAGPAGAYLFHALNADPRVLNADVYTTGPGNVTVAIQGRENGAAPPADVIAAVRAYLNREDIKPLTDVVSVIPVAVVPYTITVVGYVRPGPDPAALRQAIIASLQKMAAARRTPGRDVPRSAVITAASVEPVDRVEVSAPAANVIVERGQLAVCTAIAVTVSTYDG